MLRCAVLAALFGSCSARGGRGAGPPITPGQGCYDMSGSISGGAHHCLYTPEHCCQGGCEANGGYWIDGTGSETCTSDPDCDDDNDRTICGCDRLTQCGDSSAASDINNDGAIDLDCSDGNCDKLCVLGNCPEEEGGPICGPLGPRFGGGHSSCVANPECQWCEVGGSDICAPQGSPMCPERRGGGHGGGGGGGGNGNGGGNNGPDPTAERGPNCSDGEDNDGDGLMDCADDDCCVGHGSSRCRAQCQLRTLTAIAVFHTDDGLSGTVRFRQLGSSSPTHVSVSLSGLQDGPNPWHIHEAAVRSAGDCSAESVGDHFDPVGWADSGGSAQGVWDLGGAGSGDLASDWQGEDQQGDFDAETLPLFGDDSIMGRSIVIHKADGSRWACATIFDAASPATARVDFSGPLDGSVQLTQYAAGAPTIVQLDFNAVAYAGSNWEIHSGSCNSVGRPFLTRDVYNLGDNLGMLGGTMHYTRNVATLPLFGEQTVGGKVIVVKDAQGQQWACAPVQQLLNPPDQGAAMEHFGVPESARINIPKCSSAQGTAHVNQVCCAGGADCSAGTPTSCSMQCAPVFLDFWNSCKALFKGNHDASHSMRLLATDCEDVMAASPVPASSRDNLGTGCQWTLGDGVGGAEVRVGSASTPADCVAMVQQARPDAIGATYQVGGFDCYAEMDMTGVQDAPRWQTCTVDGAAPPAIGDGSGGCATSAAVIMEELQTACGFSGFALPRECSIGCAAVFTPLYRDCQAELYQAELESDFTMQAVQAFVSLCGGASSGGGRGGGGH